MIKPKNGLQFNLKIHTYHDIIPEESKLKFLPTRVTLIFQLLNDAIQ